tara:strand:+ start:2376 stop:2564 length:189 start_codon:yes stop_codon:yes gene_type:complete
MFAHYLFQNNHTKKIINNIPIMPFPSLSQPGWVLAGAPKLKAREDLILFNNKIMIMNNFFIV